MPLFVGDYGQTISIRFLDDEEKALDISFAVGQTIVMEIVKPDGGTTEEAVSTPGGGTDGLIVYAIIDGFIDMAGLWKVRGKAEDPGTKEVKTDFFEFEVGP